MDKPIDNVILQKKRRLKLIRIGLLLAVLLTVFFLLSAWIRPSVDRNDIQTAFVTRGSIEASISASGLVLPTVEQAISSPGETRLLAVRKKPGETVRKGESILDLDRSELTLTLEKTGKELSLKGNQRTQLKLDMDRTLGDLRGQKNIKDLRGQYLKSKLEQSEKMFALGAISKDQLEQSRLEERIATIERQDLEQLIRGTTQSLENQLEGISTEFRTLLREEADVRRQLDLLSCRAAMNGIVTWVNEQIGAGVHSGEILARVADLSSYRVEASVSDIHAAHLSVGMPAKIRLKDAAIPGQIRTIYPTIENGIVKVSLSLADPTNDLLRPNLRVDVYIITSKKDSTLKVKKGPFINGDGQQEIFVVRGNTAERITASIGVMSFEEAEIQGPIFEGDEIITSDVTRYIHLAQFKIH